MSNTTKGIDIAGEIKNGKPQIREFNHKALPEEKQKIFTENARALLSKIESNIDKSMNLI
ncbi:MAG: hypothetical protein V3W20_11260 [Candidatus Neomarinimicrobiota bacterium]